MRIVIVIPAYNEARTIRDIVCRTLPQCDRVIVVDDGSTDDTAQLLEGLPIVLLRHERNCGKGAALWSGFMQALALEADAIVTMDGDGQHRPEDIGRLVAAAAAHPHRLVIAARIRRRESVPRGRNAANRLADFSIGWAAGHPVIDSQSGQRLYPAELIRHVSVRHDDSVRYALETDILIRAARLGYPTVAVPIDAIYDPAARASHFRPMRDLCGIARVVWGHLVRCWFSPRGLWRSVRLRPFVTR